jgi:hypothetical protein
MSEMGMNGKGSAGRKEGIKGVEGVAGWKERTKGGRKEGRKEGIYLIGGGLYLYISLH